MADSLTFDGIDDYIRFSAGNTTSPAENLTVAVAMKLVANEAASKSIIGPEGNFDASWGVDNASPHHATFWAGAGGAPTSTFTCPASDGWCIYAYNGPHGNCDLHKYVFGTSTWTHENKATFAGDLATITAFIVGAGADLSQPVDANILIAAWWDSNLSQATIETLTTGTAAWVAAAPVECWRLNSMSAISSLTGTSSETTRVGTALATGDVPAGWTDVGQVILPDADIVTTGWATAPLFSKVNDASDATVITATSS